MRVRLITSMDIRQLIVALHRFLACALVLFVTWSLLSPDPFAVVRHSPLSSLEALSDLILHFGAFAVLSGALLTALPVPSSRITNQVMAVGLIGYAIGMEFLQAFVPGRTCDPRDAVANLAGIVGGMGICLAFDALLRQRHEIA